MYKALVFKELRDTIGIGLLALLAYLAVIVDLMGYRVLFPFMNSDQIIAMPFLNNQLWIYIWISAIFASVLGLWQTVTESKRGTWLFLLHRPISMRKLICVKMAVGVGLYFAVSIAAVSIYVAWASIPGTHASPFFWWMTVSTLKVGLLTLLGYFGAFLAGIRPGRWIGTRLLPLLAAGILAVVLGGIGVEAGWWFCALTAFVLICVIFIGLIFYVAQTRDFS
jgi:hypothetical protein